MDMQIRVKRKAAPLEPSSESAFSKQVRTAHWPAEFFVTGRFPTYEQSVHAAEPDRHADCRCVSVQAMLRVPGDHAMCTNCGRWYHVRDNGDTYDRLPVEVAIAAFAPMDPDECLAALDDAAARMEQY